MDENYIWAYYSMKKGDLDNDYYFYNDGRMLHHYDRTIQKRDIESYISSCFPQWGVPNQRYGGSLPSYTPLRGH